MITDSKWQEVADFLNDWYDTKIAVTMLKGMDPDPDIEREIIEDTYTDTMPRGILIDMVSKHVLGMFWPINGDSETYQREFIKAARKASFK